MKLSEIKALRITETASPLSPRDKEHILDDIESWSGGFSVLELDDEQIDNYVENSLSAKYDQSAVRAWIKEYIDAGGDYDVHSIEVTDISHNPTDLSALVFAGSVVPDSYLGVNVVFIKGGKVELVTNDKLADWQADNHEDEIIAAAKKEIMRHADSAKYLKQLGHSIKISEIFENSEYEPKSRLGRALNSALSTQKKISPVQVQRNKDRWAKIQADKKNNATEGKMRKETEFEDFGPLPKAPVNVKIAGFSVHIERVPSNPKYFGYTWTASDGKERYEEARVEDLGSFDDLKKIIEDEIKFYEDRVKRQKSKVTEGKMRKETASDAFYRYDKLKKSFKNPTPEQQKLLDNVLALANSLMDEQFKKTQSNLEAKYAGSDWWEEVKKMYKIKEEGNKWIVVSNARDWKQTKDWEFDTKYEALEQLEKLIKYKMADRKAGKGSFDKDFERVDALRKREES